MKQAKKKQKKTWQFTPYNQTTVAEKKALFFCSFSFMVGSGKVVPPLDLTVDVSASLWAFVVERQRRKGRGVEVAHNLVQTGDLLLQKVVFLFGDLLPLLRDLKSLQQLRVLHVQVVDQHVCFAVLVPLQEFRQRRRSLGWAVIKWPYVKFGTSGILSSSSPTSVLLSLEQSSTFSWCNRSSSNLSELTCSFSWETFSFNSSLTLCSESSTSFIRSSMFFIFLSLSSCWEENNVNKLLLEQRHHEDTFSALVVPLRKKKLQRDF